MTEYQNRKIKLPADVWAKLDKMVAETGDTVTIHFFVRQAVESMVTAAEAPASHQAEDGGAT